ncbi:hypothetical protein DMA11_00165 [Marinilabiliaceae bacterium JC017]|nr:hypothetical protein DMA11_00165 [Marinilabiliaceae bacterium JC017]
MFSSIVFRKLRNSEFLQFLKDLLVIICNCKFVVEPLKNKIDPLKKDVDVFVAVYNPEKGSSLTREIVELDKRRDNALTGLELVLEGFSYSYDEEISEAALVLFNSINHFGKGLTRLNYQAETSVIQSLVNQWETDETMVNAISKLNLTHWVNELVQANTLFTDTYLLRVKESARASEVKLVDVRKEVIMHYRALLHHIGARATLEESGNYDLLIREINQLIEKYKMIRQRETKESKTENADKEA